MRVINPLLSLILLPIIKGWVPSGISSGTSFLQRQRAASCLRSIEVDSLLEMDVVVYSLQNDENKTERLGAVQEDGTLSPLSVWSVEPAFGDSLEFLVDEEDRFPGLTAEDVIVHRIVPQESLAYGSRQVGGGMGPSNPHGEESELLYYVDENIITNIELIVKPELEIFW
ncbi:predicted protein [Phaeodactylum tricornutum CCAP 1055/1]|jgi:hypothetical protein|uniref:Uncharacterized protein n=1 Tax=Phaeodactylum tricornutum (strain CCAP 1055/1) TaxID=556484 RepID=B7GB83_PHATC|nr:predicted protein [Phaeodactylum tricornutum CCAP 1055/1]EEC44170.1 predicted protein [Phaeodactylum tricornutum CCAP 1055/1]|eukprot:XP_002184421.1 predicted protein [Phaeodactylum tricornutum CCAP 1055/1]